ncbi:MAG: signal recognition particle-docking protein FtsY [Fimbriimonadales bacterium]|nr:signal recognition particle-docking protein FtsY [Fimbriimonadales bacterium]MDW8051657.1 signal recognition particle-docking protein FtsY [Armatimonadota bacterium]
MRLAIFKEWLSKVGHALTRGGLDESLLEELEETLITADMNARAVQEILDTLRQAARAQRLHREQEVRACLRELLKAWLGAPEPLRISPEPPTVYLFVGVNGVGKTTSIAKLAHILQTQGKRVLLAAGDTFRAAAIDQLQIWAERLGCDLVKHKEGADPSAVVFDAIQAARARGIDFVLVDTAGRQHTHTRLMEELKKVHRVAEKALGRPPDETLLVLDAVAGQNAIRQAEEFKRALPITGIVLAKLDSTSRGGAVLTIRKELGVPIKLVGLGEKAEQIALFDPDAFIEGLLATEPTR